MSKVDKKQLIANRMQIARQQAGLSQGQVAKLIDYHRPTISEIEAGRRSISAEELNLFSELYGVTVEWLSCANEITTNPKYDKINLAAREIAKLKDEDFNKVIHLLRSIKDIN